MNLNVKSREKWLAIGAAAIVGLLALDRLVLTPMGAVWKDRSTRITHLSREVNNGQLLLQREGGMRARWAEMRRNALSPKQTEAENEVLKAVDRWVQASRISFTSIRPQWRQHDDYVTLDCRADAFGDINAVARFLYELEKDPLAIKVEEVEITARDNAGRQLSLALRFSGLVLAAHQP
jgi:hypothetical protein